MDGCRYAARGRANDEAGAVAATGIAVLELCMCSAVPWMLEHQCSSFVLSEDPRKMPEIVVAAAATGPSAPASRCSHCDCRLEWACLSSVSARTLSIAPHIDFDLPSWPAVQQQDPAISDCAYVCARWNCAQEPQHRAGIKLHRWSYQHARLAPPNYRCRCAPKLPTFLQHASQQPHYASANH